MRSTFKVLFYLKRDKQKANGCIPLFCRITVDGKEARFGMKKDIHPKFWDVKTGRAVGRTVEATEINTLLDSTKSAIYKIYRELQERGNNVSAEKIKNTFLGIDIKHEYLLTVFDEHNKEKERLSENNIISPSTCDKYRITRKHLAEFLKKERNLSDIALKEINYEFVVDFERFLLTSRNCAKNTTAKYMQFFKHLILIAQKKEWIHKNPFADYVISVDHPDRGFLTQEEIEILIQQDFKKKHLERIRDIFVFCCFCGLSYIDVKNLTEESINRLFDNNLWITGKRGKTDVQYEVPLLEVPCLILEKYRGKQANNCLLPVVSNNSVNKYLKIIAEICGIKKKLTFHLARHTFATLALSKGVSIESVSKMLGHTNIKTTQIYAKITSDKISNDMAVFAGKVKGLESKLHGTVKRDKTENVCLKVIKDAFDFSDKPAINSRATERILKIWQNLSDSEKYSLSEMKNDFYSWSDLYEYLIDYTLDKRLNQEEYKIAVSF